MKIDTNPDRVMDALEIMAWDLEAAQWERHKKAGARQSVEAEKDFWTEDEFIIFHTIKTFREKSRTYEAAGYRE